MRNLCNLVWIWKTICKILSHHNEFNDFWLRMNSKIMQPKEQCGNSPTSRRRLTSSTMLSMYWEPGIWLGCRWFWCVVVPGWNIPQWVSSSCISGKGDFSDAVVMDAKVSMINASIQPACLVIWFKLGLLRRVQFSQNCNDFLMFFRGIWIC